MLGFWLILLVLLLGGCGGTPEEQAAIQQAVQPITVPPDPPPRPEPPVPPMPVPLPPGPTPEPDPPAQVPSTTVRWRMSGTFADGRTMRWTFTYDHDDAPTAVNVRDDPNAIYAMRDVEIQVEAGGVPGLEQPAIDLSTAPTEFCIGECIFSPELYLRLYAATPTNQLQLLFIHPMAQGLPRTVLDWGAGTGSLKTFTETGEFVLLVLMRSVTIEAIDAPVAP